MGVNLAIHDISSAITLSNIRTEVKFLQSTCKSLQKQKNKLSNQVRKQEQNSTTKITHCKIYKRNGKSAPNEDQI